MTYNVFGGTLNLAQSINQSDSLRSTVNKDSANWKRLDCWKKWLL